VDLSEDGVGYGGREGEHPQGRDDLAGAPQTGHGVRIQRMTNGQISELIKKYFTFPHLKF